MDEPRFFIRIFACELSGLRWISTVKARDQAACLTSARDAGAAHAAAAAYVAHGDCIRRLGVYGPSGFLLQGDELR